MNGSTHIIDDLYGCRALTRLSGRQIFERVTKIIADSGMEIRQSVCDDAWPNGALNAWWSLAESHVQVETCPEAEEGFLVKVTVELCNFTQNNYQRAVALTEALKQFFDPIDPLHFCTRKVSLRGPNPGIVEMVARRMALETQPAR